MPYCRLFCWVFRAWDVQGGGISGLKEVWGLKLGVEGLEG